ncbi:hypothetical protein, partial [Staphylococcus borealis]
RMVRVSRDILRGQLPPELAKDKVRFEAIDLMLSFEAWSRLRREQALSPKRATEVLRLVISGLLDEPNA